MSTLLDQIDQATMTRLHRRLAWSAGLGIFLDGYDIMIIGAVLLLLKKQWHLDAHAVGYLGSAALAGAFAGALIGGRIADRFGRKAIYLIDLLTFFLAAILCASAWNIASLVAFRFLLGVGIGADYPLSATYMAEFMPTVKRGGVITWTFGLWTAGAIFAGLVGFALVHLGPWAWRLMFLVGAAPALLVVWLRQSLPESPRWYLRRGQVEQATSVLRQLVPNLPAAEVSDILVEQRRKVNIPNTPVRVLFGRRFLRATLFVCIPWFIMDLVGYYLTIYIPQILGHLGFHGSPSKLLGSMILSASFLIGYVPLALLVDRIGRVWPQIIGFVGGGIGLAIVGLTALQSPTKIVMHSGMMKHVAIFSTTAIVIMFAGMLVSQILNSFGPGNTTYLLAAEVYPTDVRATGHGFATAFSRLGAVASTFFLPVIEYHIGTPVLMLWLAGGSIFGGVLTWLLRVETTCQPLIQE